MLEGGLDDGRVVRDGQQRVAVDALAVALGVDLDVAAQHADRISVDRLVEAFHQSVVHHHHGQHQTHGQHDDDGSAAVPPDVAPGKAQIQLHV